MIYVFFLIGVPFKLLLFLVYCFNWVTRKRQPGITKFTKSLFFKSLLRNTLPVCIIRHINMHVTQKPKESNTLSRITDIDMFPTRSKGFISREILDL